MNEWMASRCYVECDKLTSSDWIHALVRGSAMQSQMPNGRLWPLNELNADIHATSFLRRTFQERLDIVRVMFFKLPHWLTRHKHEQKHEWTDAAFTTSLRVDRKNFLVELKRTDSLYKTHSEVFSRKERRMVLVSTKWFFSLSRETISPLLGIHSQEPIQTFLLLFLVSGLFLDFRLLHWLLHFAVVTMCWFVGLKPF